MRLIDADALDVFVKTVRRGLYLDKTLSDIPIRDSMLLNFQQYVHLQPTISAVPVVRCRECKHNRNCFIKEMIIAETKQDNPYCSCGARMDGEP